MEADQNPLPRIDLFPRVTRLAHFIFDHITSEGLSDHNTGAAPMLDSYLYDQVQTEGFLYTGEPRPGEVGAVPCRLTSIIEPTQSD